MHKLPKIYPPGVVYKLYKAKTLKTNVTASVTDTLKS